MTIATRLLKALPIHFTWRQFLNVTWQVLSDTTQDYVTLVLDTKWVLTAATRPSQEPVLPLLTLEATTGGGLVLTDRTKGILSRSAGTSSNSSLLKQNRAPDSDVCVKLRAIEMILIQLWLSTAASSDFWGVGSPYSSVEQDPSAVTSPSGLPVLRILLPPDPRRTESEVPLYTLYKETHWLLLLNRISAFQASSLSPGAQGCSPAPE